ncbi:MAG: ABC transporter permease [Propionibacteriaceae bacterium]|jgi:peptide/nickel transport system permease protein|nr:ABC transporter permease [Propionibacteriaceae bacterium]
MAAYLVRRSALLLASLAASALLVFWLLRILPGDPANALLSQDATAEQVAAARAKVGSDLPWGVQLERWLAGLGRLDLGRSLASGQSVAAEIAQRLTVTLPLIVAAFLLSALLAVGLGCLAAFKADRWYGVGLSGLSQIGVAVPVFWVGLILVWLVALGLNWLPSGGFPGAGWGRPDLVAAHLALPTATIALGGQVAYLTRYVRAAALDVLGSDYLRTARSLGASLPAAFLRHGLRNAAVPVVSVLGVELGTTIMGAVVVESVFSLPGVGALLVQGIEKHDYPVVQGTLLIVTGWVLLVGFAADIAQRLIDPRLRQHHSQEAS